MSDSEFTNSSGGLSRRENERPTPINLSKSLISQQIGYSVECTRKSNFRSAQIDFLPSPLGEGKRKAAFTLAEVLITLGIIGVVAALTLPTLISNYQKRVYVTQLKKSVSVLSQGFTTMMGHDGVTELKDTEAFSGMGTETCDSSNILTDNCRSLREGLQSVFSGIQFTPCEGGLTKLLNGNSSTSINKNPNNTSIKFPDGSEIYNFQFYKSPSAEILGYFFIDLNGPKNPNTLGRDIFVLYIINNGVVEPSGSLRLADMRSGGGATPSDLYWRTATHIAYKCSDPSTDRGFGCAARVLEEDAMNY